MSSPFLSTNIGGGSIPWVTTPPGEDPVLIACTPGPFAVKDTAFNRWRIATAVPPYPEGTPASAQDLEGTGYLTLANIQDIERHGWRPRTWRWDAEVQLFFPDGDFQKLDFFDEFEAAGDAAPIPPNLSVEPGGDYEYHQTDRAEGGGSVPHPAGMRSLGAISNESGWAESAEGTLTDAFLKYQVKVRIGRARRRLAGVGDGICEAEFFFHGEVGRLEGSDPTIFVPYSTNCRDRASTVWRQSATETFGDMNGSIEVQDHLFQTYWGGRMMRSPRRGPESEADLSIFVTMRARWFTHQSGRPDISP